MSGQLSTEQVLLLENLMYITTESPLVRITDTDSQTIEDWLNEINISELESNTDYGSYMTGSDWKNIITAVKNDPVLMNMEIIDTHVDNNKEGSGGGLSAVFKNPDTGEAVVAFRGTASDEWKDNFVGGGPTGTTDGVSTQQQLNALEWYQSLDKSDFSSITITGHSKGGNKAKYITIMDNSVDRCISFDGQGFSDEFLAEYQDKIASNQDKIQNHNVNYDYVNILLNDVGEKTYYRGYELGEGGFLENHCPNTFLNFKEDGTFSISSVGQGEEMKELDQFLNSYLRSLPPEKKADALAFIGEIAEMGLGGEFDTNELLQLFFEGNNVDNASYLLAYLIEYEQKYPEFAESINGIMKNFGMEDIGNIVKLVEDVMNSPYFDLLYDGINGLANMIPGFILDKLAQLAQEHGIQLTEEQIRELIQALSKINHYMDDIQVEKSGSDKVIKSTSQSSGSAKFEVKTRVLYSHKESLERYYQNLENASDEIASLNRCLSNMKSYTRVKRNLNVMETRLNGLSQKCKKMRNAIEDIAKCYDETESRIIAAVK
ncbi:MAG: DUF2974 domain-containing protein [Lachnospiraceae bacterium]|nr:DUF2974 domain-containing protein [Lachnospiraceae bacterium]